MSCNIFLFLLISCVRALVQSDIEPGKLVDIQNYLKKINKPALKTIQSPDGDLIDCVLFHQQPAFDNPLLQGHNKKPDLPEPVPPKGFLSNNNDSLEEVFQLWRMSGESCPENTIPIRRTTEEDVLRASSLQTFGRKRASNNNNNNNNKNIANSNEAGANHQHAIVYVTGDMYYGAQTFINVWHPKVESKGEFSLAQMWLLGTTDGVVQDSIEVGSIVHLLDQDRFQNDGYGRSGCYDLQCGGFIHLCSDVSIGAAISPISTYKGQQHDIQVTVWKAKKDGNWWLAVNGNHVGYWPSALFPLLRYQADAVEFGGEIAIIKSQWQTMTQMGSGHFCTKKEQRFGRTAFLRNLQIIDSSNQIHTPKKFGTVIDTPDEYSAHMDKGKIWGTYMYYGFRGGPVPFCTGYYPVYFQPYDFN